MRKAGFSGFVLAIALAISPACNSAPTLPLPPPVATVGTPDMQGYALVSGEVNPLSYVFVFNEESEGGVITRADEEGLFEARILAEPGDVITIWQEADGITGEQKQVAVPDD
jgi:hypothetical protein